MSRVSLLCIAALAACGPRGGAGPAPVSVPAEALHDQTLGELPAGLSGLTRLAEGGLLAVPERTREAVLFAPGGERVLGTVPITGAPEGLDLESVAWMGGDRVALGTESRAAGRVTDLVLLGRLSDDALALDGVIELSWAPFGMRAGSNHGIEGVCAADGTLVAVGEEVGNDQGRRFAPAWIRARQGGVVHTARLLLSSEKGKASGAACRIDAEGRIELHVLERHFDTVRVATYRPSREGGVFEPVAVRDLAAALGDDPPNPEGLAWDPGTGTLWIVTDNDYGGVTGPAHLLRLDLGK